MRDLAALGAGLDRVRRILAGLDDDERAQLEATWRTRAACRGADPDTFFPPGDGERLSSGAYAEARAICESCAVWELCLARYLHEPCGCFGASTPQERLKLRRQRGELADKGRRRRASA